MRILIMNQHPQDVVGGSEVQCHLLATQLTRLGHQVVYLAINGKSQKYDVPYLVVPSSLRWGELRKVVLEHRPDVVYWRFNKRKFLLSMLLLKILNIKVVFAISHQNDIIKWSHKVKFHPGCFSDCLRTWYSYFRQIIASRVNHFGFYGVDGIIAQLHQQTGKISASKELVIYNSVDSSVIPFSWEKPFIVWIANIKASKNPKVFIQLARCLEELAVDCVMVGNVQHAQYRSYLEASDLPSNFHYLGSKLYGEVNGILQKSLFLVHTCDPEGFPNIFIQAWMQEKPTVSLYYDPDGMIVKEKIGYLSGAFDQFVQDTKALIENDALRAEMGKRARQYARQHFDPEQNARHLAAFFEEVCAT